MDTATLAFQELLEAWPLLSAADRVEGFSLLSRVDAEELFFSLSASDQIDLLLALPQAEQKIWVRILDPDDAADLLQLAEPEQRESLLHLLDDNTRREVTALMAYAEDEAGGLMNPRFARLRPDMTLDEAIAYLRRQTRDRAEVIYYAYVLDNQQKLLGVVSLRQLMSSAPGARVRDIMRTDLTTVSADLDQEAVSLVFAKSDLLALPVVDAEGRMQGIVTGDDIVDVVKEEATEDIQKIGGMEALDEPYLQAGFFEMVKKRGGWLAVLFLGETLTATAMGFFEAEIERATVLALFIPLIISSGGNSGSQACTLVIRAMALGELKLRDWMRVIGREIGTGLALGMLLGSIGVVRILAWEWVWQSVKHEPLYGEHYLLVALTVGLSLVGVVLWGTLSGSTLPFILRSLRFDPASASAPFVATLVDVTGLIIFFGVASIVLSGSLLAHPPEGWAY